MKKLALLIAMLMATSISAERLADKIYSPKGKTTGLECVPMSNIRKYFIINFTKQEVGEYFSNDYLRVEVHRLRADDNYLYWGAISPGDRIEEYVLDRADLELTYKKNSYPTGEFYYCETLLPSEVETKRYDLYSKKMEKDNKI